MFVPCSLRSQWNAVPRLFSLSLPRVRRHPWGAGVYGDRCGYTRERDVRTRLCVQVV